MDETDYKPYIEQEPNIIDKMSEIRLRMELRKALRTLHYAEIALNPRKWPAEVTGKWHRSIPDLMLAFEEIRKWAGL